ncbi:tetratricopeptide repeat protein [Winogradskyella aurantiaca]|uniref:tetratricopeptide repeat protein n=1 Tax=Winogradskyella aurantiaca TaxID=2219558 RepID=UPI000E1CF9EB|nr:tetratricopeptide repeat protein [Winogradskyella aurantiaca]
MRYLLLFIFSTILINVVNSQSLTLEVDGLFQKREYDTAAKILNEYLKTRPEDKEAYELLGDAYGYQRAWDAAIEIYSSLVSQYPEDADLYYKLGGSLGLKAQSVNKLKAITYVGDIKEALKEAIRIDPNHIEAHWALIELYIALPGILGGSNKKALDYATKLMDVSAVDCYLAKGYIYEYDDEPELAEFNYLRAVEVGGSVVCYRELSEFYQEENQPDKAIKTLEEAQELHHRNALHYQIGKVSADYKVDLDKGLICLNTYIKNYTSKDGVPIEWAYYRCAQIYRHQNNKEEALQHIDRALSLRADFPQALQERKRIQNL